jgi:hypothetical protein
MNRSNTRGFTGEYGRYSGYGMIISKKKSGSHHSIDREIWMFIPSKFMKNQVLAHHDIRFPPFMAQNQSPFASH